MKRLKKMTALTLTLCMVFTGAIPAYAEETNIPEKSAEAAEMLTEAEVSGVAVEEAVAVEAAEAIEAELSEGEAGSETPAGSEEKTEQAAMLGEDGVTKETVTYLDDKGVVQSHECIIMTSADNYTFNNDGWYAVKKNVTIKNRIENNASENTPAHLILVDGAELNAKNGIHNGYSKGLVFYGQKNGSGKLIAEMSYNSSAAIGSDCKESYPGPLTFNGGTIIATAGNNAAGIGGGDHSDSGDITINGGTITATGGVQAAGIGGGHYASVNITIKGGTVTANGGDFAAGIGGGNYGRGVVEITGGTVVSNGGWHGCGIGSGDNNNHSRITIKGGIVTATGYQAGVSIGTGEVNIDSGVLIYAGESRETAKKTDVQGLGAHFAHVAVSTEYTVSHEWQTVDGTGYVPHETETLHGGAGWHTEAAANSYKGFTAEKFSQETIVSDGSTVVSIKYKRNTNTITFDTNGRAAAPEPIKAVTGAEIKAPQAPVCEGYRFEGWYKEKECINPFTFTTMPEENLTLYAKWAADPSERHYVQYVDEDGNTKEASCIILSTDKNAYAFDTGEWYAVTNSITIGSRIENNASESPAHLILADGALLAVKGGIHNPDGKGLVIYGQSAGSGTLSISNVPRDNTGIGYGYLEDSGKITINGGTVSATGGIYGNGIGGKMTINGGTVTAAGGYGRAALGGNYHEDGGTLVFGRNPGVLRAGSSKDDASDIDVDLYKEKFRDYGFVMINYATASYTVEHWKQKIIRSDDYQYDTTETLTGFVDSYAEVVSKEYPGYGDPQYTPEKIKADGTTKIIAKYDLIYNTISFDANGHGTAPDPIYAVPGAAISAPKNPSAEGYTFGGWYIEPECTNQYVFSTMPSEDKTLYAKWTPIPYTITWKDGNTVLRTDKVDYDTMPDYGPDPSKTGYEFLLWWPTVQKVTGDATYNAIFFKPTVKCTVTWMLNDIKLIDTTEVTEGEMPVHENPEREGYIFIGWKPALAPVTGNIKYTAYFEERGEHKAAVTFNTDGGTFINTQVIEKGSIPVKPSDPQKKGYKFEGWYREAGFVTPYKFNESVNADMILYAKWTELPVAVYTVTWKLDDETLIDTTEVKEGDMPSHSSPAKEGYIFLGWDPALQPVTGNITYTAKFEKRTSEKAAVTFNTDGGSFIETQVVTKGQKAVRPSNPVKSGYSFVNWYADAAFTTAYDFNASVNADTTLYAKWQKNAGREYTITWKDWNGNVLASQKVSEGGLPDYPGASNPSRSGYIFTGWAPKLGLAYADKTYTATYSPQTIINGGGGGGSTPAAKKPAVTFSPNWYTDELGVWRIKNSAGQVVTNAWLCDDAVAANGQNVWYLLRHDGAMIAAGLVQDATGNFYSLETNHDGYFGMLSYTDGYYNCNGQQVYLKFSHEHNGTFGAVINADGIEKLKAIYGVTKYGIGNDNAVYTKTF